MSKEYGTGMLQARAGIYTTKISKLRILVYY